MEEAVAQAISLMCSRTTGPWHTPEELLLGQVRLLPGQPGLEAVLECPAGEIAHLTLPTDMSAGKRGQNDSEQRVKGVGKGLGLANCLPSKVQQRIVSYQAFG